MEVTMLLPPLPDRRWRLARQMGVARAVTKLAPELTGGDDPPWAPGVVARARARFAEGGLALAGLEGDQFDLSRIKFGLPGRDDDLERYRAMLREAGREGVSLVCQNFMCGVGWFRTDARREGRGGALVSAFRAADAAGLPPAGPGGEEVPPERVWDNLAAFLRAVVPEAEAAGVCIALHPDDPPVASLRGVARVLTSGAAMERACRSLVPPSPALGVTFCAGTFASAGEDVPALVRRLGPLVRFAHVRDVRGRAEDFVETFPEEGQTDTAAVFRAYAEAGFAGLVRPDHAPAMAGEERAVGDAPEDGGGQSVGYEPTGMVYTLGYMRGLLDGGVAAAGRRHRA